MSRKRRTIRLPIEVLLFNRASYALALFVLGGLAICRSMEPSGDDFVPTPAPSPERMSLLLELQVRMQQQQRHSLLPLPPTSVRNVLDLDVPGIEVQIPTIHPRIFAPLGGNRLAFHRAFKRDRLRRPANGIEKLTVIIDASPSMMEDRKGGLLAYGIVKEQALEVIDNLRAAILFNVIIYEYANQIRTFRPQMVPANTPNKDAFAEWLRPLNEDPEKLGATIGDDYSLQQSVAPIFDAISHHWRAVHAAMEMQTDAIVFITDGWSNNLVQPYPEDLDVAEWQRRHGWTEENEQAYRDALQRGRDWVERESKAREARGMPPMVVQDIRTVVRKNLREETPFPPYPPREQWEKDELMLYFQKLGSILYPGERNPFPEVQVIVFRGTDEGWSLEQDQHVRSFVRHSRGTHRILEGLEAVQPVTGRQ